MPTPNKASPGDGDKEGGPDLHAEAVDLSQLRGTTAPREERKPVVENTKSESDDDLDALAEIVPDVKSRKSSISQGGVKVEEPKQPADPGKDQVQEEQTRRESQDKIQAEAIPTKEDKIEPEKPVKEAARIDSQLTGEHFEEDTSSDGMDGQSRDVNDVLYGNGDDPLDDVDSDRALSSENSKARDATVTDPNLGIPGGFQNISSAQSLSTATQTHEVRMPMYLPTFKPATGCTNASDFIVRCFVARLRSGITVVKHGRSRWCKSRLRVLHIHQDGRSLSWKPAHGEPTSSKRPPKLDLTTCLEVRHAWSPDPQNPMYTGTPILRQKCEAANAHKSFALIFPKRTVDITSVTADQCKVLMEGFSALCFRLQVANLAGQGNKKGGQKMPEEEEVATTASGSLTNTSTLSPRDPAKARR